MAKKKEIIGYVLLKLDPPVHKALKVVCAQKGLPMQQTLHKLVERFVNNELPEVQCPN